MYVNTQVHWNTNLYSYITDRPDGTQTIWLTY